jgi:hypothetical protein
MGESEVVPESCSEYDENGVDRTLVRANLDMTPLECLELLEELHQLESVNRVGEPIPPLD